MDALPRGVTGPIVSTTGMEHSPTSATGTGRERIRSLFRGSTSPDDSADLQEKPLHAGIVNTDTQGAGEPSLLATERVQRAPAIAESRSPLGSHGGWSLAKESLPNRSPARN